MEIRAGATLKIAVAYVIAASVLSACAGPSVRTVAPADNGTKLSVGFTNAMNNRMREGRNVYFVRLKESAGSFVPVEIASERLVPNNDSEEVLAYVRDDNWVLPAYDSAALFNAPTGTFQCGPLFQSKKVVYHPCSSGSKLVGASAGASVGRNAVALITTLGLGSGIDYGVDTQKILTILESGDVLAKIERFDSVRQYAAKASNAVAAEDGALSKAAQPQIKVVNETGFPTPSITKSALRYSVRRDNGIAPPNSVELTQSSDPYAPLIAAIDAQKNQLMLERTFAVTCNDSITVAAFSASQQCANSVTVRNGILSPQISVTLKSIDLGVRYPDFQHSDGKIAATIKEGGLVVANLTGQYAEILSLSLYADKEIAELEVNMSLAPGAENRDPISMDRLANRSIREKFTMKGIRLADVRGKSVNYGLAVKYRLGDGNNFQTLHRKVTVPLLSLIPALDSVSASR
jgi:hypothetical protein